MDLEVNAFAGEDFLGVDIHVREPEVALELGEGNDVFVFGDQEELYDFFLLFEMGQDVFLGEVLGVVFADDGGVGLVHGVD